MKIPNLKKITTNGRAIYLAYDQGLEHGPADFNDKNVNPCYIIDIAKKGRFNAVIFQKGIAEKYHEEIRKSKVPLIVKLNGKTNLVKGEPISRLLCTVEEALKLGASGIGYTIYIGSAHEDVMLEEFEIIQKKAHEKNLPVIVWIYPRGKSVEKKSSKDLMAYACRVGLEIGADIIKIQYNGDKKDLEWAIKNAGKTKVVIAGGIKKDSNDLYKQIKEIMQTGAIGLAIGRNIWQAKNPLEISEKIRGIIMK
ncbi:MAG: class I fructose-bisphosphate aldolase [Nanoarchaeota archaeon]